MLDQVREVEVAITCNARAVDAVVGDDTTTFLYYGLPKCEVATSGTRHSADSPATITRRAAEKKPDACIIPKIC